MDKKEERLLIGLLIIICIGIMIWFLMSKKKYDKQKDEYTYFNDFTGNSPNYNSCLLYTSPSPRD